MQVAGICITTPRSVGFVTNRYGPEGPRLGHLVQTLQSTSGIVCAREPVTLRLVAAAGDALGVHCDAGSVSLFSGGNACETTLKSPLMGKQLQVPQEMFASLVFLLKLLGQNLAPRKEVTVCKEVGCQKHGEGKGSRLQASKL